MTFQRNNHHIFNWRRLTKRKTADPKPKTDDIDEWMKRVEMASELAVSEVFSGRRWTSGAASRATALQRTEQLRDHDDAYTEAQALLSDWMSSKLRLELEVDEENEPDACTVPAAVQPAVMDYSSSDELYKRLAEEEEDGEAVSSFLQQLMDRELLDPGTAEDLLLDSDQARRKTRDPSITMEARHRQVREDRALRVAERERRRVAQEAQRGAEDEARRRERWAEARRQEEARRREAAVQEEAVKLRRQMEEQRALEQLVRQKEREKTERRRTAGFPPRGGQAGPGPDRPEPSAAPRAERSQAGPRIAQLQCRAWPQSLQRCFSGWFSVVLERRLALGRAAALSDWRRSLRAWRAWSAVVRASRERRERERTEEELREEHRRDQLAAGGDRMRLLRRCFNAWQLWCRSEAGQRALLAQQEQTRKKMAALIHAASTMGQLRCPGAPGMLTTEGLDVPGTPDGAGAAGQNDTESVLVPAPSSGRHGDAPAPVSRPRQAWQVTRSHAAVSERELRRAQQRRGGGGGGGGGVGGGGGGGDKGPRFEHRHAAQQQTIALQQKLLREQQEQILQLQEERGLLEARGAAASPPRPGVQAPPRGREPPEQRAQGRTADQGSPAPPRKEANQQPPCPDPVVLAMEERARKRLERKKEVEELRRKKQEEKLAEMRAAEEEQRREAEEARRGEAQKRREERRLQLEREQEKEERCLREQEQQAAAQRHHHRSLLLRRGLAPWQLLLRLKSGNEQLAVRHHRGRVLLTCLRAWQHWTGDSLCEKHAAADQLNRHLLLRRGVACWRRLVARRALLEERAQAFHRAHTLRRVLHALLDHLTQERLLECDRLDTAEQHSSRRAACRCLLLWRRFPALQREEREREARREQLRRKVAEVLPDFRSSPLGPPSPRPDPFFK